MTDLAKTSVRLDAGEDDIVPLSEAVKVWARVAALSFGGPAGQIAVMHRIVVDEKRWVGEHRFLHALNYCMLLPGPEAHQLAIYIGWLLNKTRGGMIAGLLFVLPGFLSILALSYIYVIFGDVTAIEGMFFGLKCAVLAVVVQAVFRIGSRALKNNVMVAMAAAAFVAIFFLHVPFPLIILAAAIIGCFGGGQGFTLSRQTADTSRDRARYSKTGIPSSARTFPFTPGPTLPGRSKPLALLQRSGSFPSRR